MGITRTAPVLLPAAALFFSATILHDKSHACIIMPPDREAAVDVVLDAIEAGEMRISSWDREDLEAGRACSASLVVNTSQFPSLSVLPAPRDLAGLLVPVLDEWEDESCSIWLHVTDDAEAGLPAEDQCWTGTYGYANGRWWATDADAPCWSAEDLARWEHEYEEFLEREQSEAGNENENERAAGIEMDVEGTFEETASAPAAEDASV